MLTRQPAVAPLDAPRAGRTFRPDVEGLRAIAVLAVLAYHAGVPGFSGGYVGVDVFFVLSGFLITGLLVDERATSGGVSLPRFYARRARRLLPASTLVVVVTLVGLSVFGNPLQRADGADDARAVATFTANTHFADQDTGYFAQETTPSPFQHFWSLAVEEQFYFVWPATLLLLTLRARDREAQRRRILAFLAVLVPASLLLCVRLTSTSQPDAFFLLPARAWELGVGALLVVLPTRRLGRWAAAIGLGLVALAVVGFDSATAFPGWAAAVPVLGTALLVGAGAGTEVGRGLATPLLQRIGRCSYSLYLWHWAVLMVAATVKPGILESWWKSAFVVALSVPPAIVSFHLLEDPVRRSRWLARRPRRSLAMGAGLAAASLVAAVVLQPAHLDAGRVAPIAQRGAALDFVPSDLEPSLRGAADDHQPLSSMPDCDTDRETTGLAPCSFGNLASPTRIVLFGDSHAGELFTPVRRRVEAQGWRLDTEVTPSCTALLYDVAPVCSTWRDAVLDDLVAHPPTAVVLVDYGRRLYDDDPAAWRRATERTLRRLTPVTHVVLLGETPRPSANAAACLSEHLDAVRACEPDPDDPVQRRIVADGRTLAATTGADFVDLAPLVCGADRCPIVRGNLLVYRDGDHLTQPFVRSVTDQFGRLLAAVGV